ncbi:PREDICTED: taste receptor type 2 member 14-like [Chinchilla lanigera]|uniref:taste receptor type 2 member 14-like n=1 Tax=Chinchilla lanigera TaxID=34839 RepID=UPI00069898A4|nr:PREDICTED: taste receptor type 2 member 14-like [Chinchilla lanigera]
MSSVTLNIFTIIVSVEFLMGNLGNGFIILVNCMDLINSRKISVVDHLLTALAISRISLLWLLFTNWWKAVFFPTFWMNIIMVRILYMVWIVTCHFSMWLATCLSLFYCLKIATFSNSIFLYCKWRVKKVVSVMLLVSLVLLLLQLLQSNMHLDMLIDEYERNTSYRSSFPDFLEFSKLLLYSNTLFTFTAFALSLITFLLLIFSLWKHLKRTQHSVRGSRDVSTKAHIQALQAVVIFLLLYTTFFLSIFMQLWKFEFSNILYFYFCQIGEITFPSIHSFVLILGNNKLKQAYLSVLKWLKCVGPKMNLRVHKPFGGCCIF